MSDAQNPEKRSSRLDSATSATSTDDECVVCFKVVNIFSIGECDHPVCFECSTRMRVLCQQNECPICRQVLSKVIFTSTKLPYRELEAKNRSEYYNRKFKISFSTNEIQRAFFKLLDHPCPKCEVAPYRKFPELCYHVRKEHDLHYCDLCTENLKIFTFERRCYTQTELGLHRTKGDTDNRSHRGHPLCEYCNKRFLDRDELFRHLRREHYFCHFCDADGYNEFYNDYNALADHFRQDHFLCEEGNCATEEFIGAFRTEIDYKAHVANMHGSLMNKQQAKQTRTLQLEITLGPRGRPMQSDASSANLRSRGGAAAGGGNEEAYEAAAAEAAMSMSARQQRSITIDACNEEDFPSLRGTGSGPNVSLTRPPPLSMRNKSATAGLARTKENFPALGANGGGGVLGPVGRSSGGPMAIASVVRKPPTAATGAVARTAAAGNAAGPQMIHVSNRPSAQSKTTMDFPALPTNNNSKSKRNGRLDEDFRPSPSPVAKTHHSSAAPPQVVHVSNRPIAQKQQPTMDFPALANNSKSKRNSRLEEDFLPSPSPVPMTNVAAKHRLLVDDYVSVANPSNFQKMQMVQKETLEAKAQADKELLHAPKLTSMDFPSLGGGAFKAPAPSWGQPPTNERKLREVESRKAKVAPAPLLLQKSASKNGANKPATAALSNNNTSYASSTGANEPAMTAANKKEKKNKENKSTDNNVIAGVPHKSNGNGTAMAGKERNNNNNVSATSQVRSTRSQLNGVDSVGASGGSGGDDSAASGKMRPPPGFAAGANKAPPGFHSTVTLNSVAKSPNSLTFTSSLGESYSIVPTHAYVQPPEALRRNQQLVGYFKEALRTPEALEEFRHISQNYRDGIYKPNAYYEHCQAALKGQFDKVFPELVALLPDIAKQQELFLVHTQQSNQLPASARRQMTQLEVCATCKQVLTSRDADNHRKVHSMRNDFPTLNASAGRGGVRPS